ncbi:hypothetical protein HF086_004084 [Spodoptera exigua]|uniref:Transporter n=1 Tax=Spodoptera exigua TaxID=7107 RepID=A0A922MAG9_SPOEX|nr:hypothetical protein HF086_004084 [Spodoptera exigua]
MFNFQPDKEKAEPERAVWGNQIEFLMSCIATSVGLGNVWRFPFIAYQNGGGAFLIPYIIVLLLIGKPMYYLECVLGQFSSKNSVTVWSLSPAMKGAGYATALGCGYILSYYVSIVALCLYYLCMSFLPTLPRTVLQQIDGIEDGLGVKSSGKAAYFLALFPYVVMLILLITTSILPGAGTGILFFLTPQWNKLIELDVWYAAVTQVFFSLSVCTGAIIMFSSYNGFRQNVYRDAMIVTTLDTFTSLLSGFTIFGILGNLAHELNTEVANVTGSAGTGLAFISYPDAISKTFQPQLFAVLFFLMMTVLGIGSAVALLSTINTVMLDAFPRIKTIFMSAFCCTIGFGVGLIYVTPVSLENLCLDIEYMLGIKTSFYWRCCWGVIMPAMMIVVFVYALATSETLKFGEDYYYPTAGYVSGYMMLFVGVAFVPISIGLTMYKYRTGNCAETAKRSFRPKESWGPREEFERRNWIEFKREAEAARAQKRTSWFQHIRYSLFGGYRR